MPKKPGLRKRVLSQGQPDRAKEKEEGEDSKEGISLAPEGVHIVSGRGNPKRRGENTISSSRQTAFRKNDSTKSVDAIGRTSARGKGENPRRDKT